MTITDKHRTEYALIDEALNELTKVMQRMETLEATAEEYRRAAERSNKSEMMNREMIEQLQEQLVQEKTKSDALSTDLEKMTAKRNQLQTEIKDIQMSINTQMALRDAEREQLRAELQRETAERKESGELLRKFLIQIQDLTQSALGGNVQLMKEVQHSVRPFGHDAMWQQEENFSDLRMTKEMN
jgi:predicted RNase H-like nuclease (RuvC/YqgF family)